MIINILDLFFFISLFILSIQTQQQGCNCDQIYDELNQISIGQNFIQPEILTIQSQLPCLNTRTNKYSIDCKTDNRRIQGKYTRLKFELNPRNMHSGHLNLTNIPLKFHSDLIENELVIDLNEPEKCTDGRYCTINRDNVTFNLYINRVSQYIRLDRNKRENIPYTYYVHRQNITTSNSPDNNDTCSTRLIDTRQQTNAINMTDFEYNCPFRSERIPSYNEILNEIDCDLSDINVLDDDENQLRYINEFQRDRCKGIICNRCTSQGYDDSQLIQLFDIKPQCTVWNINNDVEYLIDGSFEVTNHDTGQTDRSDFVINTSNQIPIITQNRTLRIRVNDLRSEQMDSKSGYLLNGHLVFCNLKNKNITQQDFSLYGESLRLPFATYCNNDLFPVPTKKYFDSTGNDQFNEFWFFVNNTELYKFYGNDCNDIGLNYQSYLRHYANIDTLDQFCYNSTFDQCLPEITPCKINSLLNKYSRGEIPYEQVRDYLLPLDLWNKECPALWPFRFVNSNIFNRNNIVTHGLFLQQLNLFNQDDKKLDLEVDISDIILPNSNEPDTNHDIVFSNFLDLAESRCTLTINNNQTSLYDIGSIVINTCYKDSNFPNFLRNRNNKMRLTLDETVGEFFYEFNNIDILNNQTLEHVYKTIIPTTANNRPDACQKLQNFFLVRRKKNSTSIPLNPNILENFIGRVKIDFFDNDLQIKLGNSSFIDCSLFNNTALYQKILGIIKEEECNNIFTDSCGLRTIVAWYIVISAVVLGCLSIFNIVQFIVIMVDKKKYNNLKKTQ